MRNSRILLIVLGLIITILFTILTYAIGYGYDKADINELASLALQPKHADKITHLQDGVFALKEFENTTEHNNFLWTWTIHIIQFTPVHYDTGPVISHYTVKLNSKRYNNIISGNASRIIIWYIEDKMGIGECTKVNKDLKIIRKICDGKTFYEITILWPDGFMNEEWMYPTLYEGQKVYDKEIEFWLKTFGR